MSEFDFDSYLKEKSPDDEGGEFNFDNYLMEKKADFDPSASEAFGMHVPQGMLLNHADELYGAGSAAIQTMFSDEKLVDFPKTYRRERDVAREAFNATREQHPVASTAGEVTGAVSTSFTPLGQYGKIEKGMKLAQRAKQGMKAGSLMGGIYGSGSSEADLTKGEFPEYLRDTVRSTVEGGAFGAIPGKALIGGGAAMLAGAGEDIAEGDYAMGLGKVGVGVGASYLLPSAIKKGWQTGKRYFGPKKILSSLGGVGEEHIDDYVARHKEINASPDRTQVQSNIDDITANLQDEYHTAKKVLADKVDDVRYQNTQSKVDAVERLHNAEANLERAYEQQIVDVMEEVQGALGILKSKVRTGSKDAMGLLKKGDTRLKRASMMGLIKRAYNRLNVAGKTPISDAAKASQERLKAFHKSLKKLPEEIDLASAKKMIQQLDEDLKAFYSAPKGSFSQSEAVAKSRLRTYIDTGVKSEVPEYAEKMLDVADDTRALSDSSKRFGKGQYGSLKNIDDPMRVDTLDSLERLETKTGKTITPRLRRENLPEFAEVQDASQARSQFEPHKLKRATGEVIESSPELAKLKQAEEAYLPVKPIAPRSGGSTNSSTFIERIMGNKTGGTRANPNDKRMFDYLAGKRPELRDEVKNLGTLNAFTGQRANGSRNTLFGTALGGALGAMLGPVGVGGGVGVGVIVGRYLDTHGPQMTKELLDQYLAAAPHINKHMGKVLRSFDTSSKAFKKYVPLLIDASNKGNDKWATTYYLLQKDPEFRKLTMPKE